ncbi:MAG: hypothetical protein AAFZ15_32380 [Bacteroidota bacterium]
MYEINAVPDTQYIGTHNVCDTSEIQENNVKNNQILIESYLSHGLDSYAAFRADYPIYLICED